MKQLYFSIPMVNQVMLDFKYIMQLLKVSQGLNIYYTYLQLDSHIVSAGLRDRNVLSALFYPNHLKYWIFHISRL